MKKGDGIKSLISSFFARSTIIKEGFDVEGERGSKRRKRKEIKCEFRSTKEKLNHIEPGDFFSRHESEGSSVGGVYFIVTL